jgi:hypothetical protein
MNTSFSAQPIIKRYLKTTGLSRDEFATVLRTKRSLVSKWISGKDVPCIFYLLNCREEFTDWRLNFAMEVLHTMFPEVFPLPTDDGHTPELVLRQVRGQGKTVVSADQSTAESA